MCWTEGPTWGGNDAFQKPLLYSEFTLENSFVCSDFGDVTLAVTQDPKDPTQKMPITTLNIKINKARNSLSPNTSNQYIAP